MGRERSGPKGETHNNFFYQFCTFLAKQFYPFYKSKNQCFANGQHSLDGCENEEINGENIGNNRAAKVLPAALAPAPSDKFGL